jgi:hypothetical protein
MASSNTGPMADAILAPIHSDAHLDLLVENQIGR